MQRRTVVRALGTGTVLFTGCLDRSQSGPAEPSTKTTSSEPSTASASPRLSITDVRSYTHAIRLNDLGESPRGDVPAVESFSDREQSVVTSAIDETYTTRSPPEWLLQFVAETTYVSQEDQYYRLTATMPTTTITATPVSRDDVTGEIASYEAYEQAVTHDGVVMSGLLRSAQQGGETLPYVWPTLDSFLSTYDAVEYHGDVLALSTTRNDPGSPYSVDATVASLSDLAGGSVWRLSAASPAVQDVVRSAAAKSGLYAFESPPDGLLAQLREHKYVYVGGRFYTTYVEQAGPQPLEIDATVEDATLDADGARIRLTLRNTADSELDISSGAPKPFGVLRYQPAKSTADSGLLWSPAYEDSSHVHTEDGEVTAVNSIALQTSIEPDGTVARTFTVDDPSLSPGRYRIENDVGYSTAAARDGTFPYVVRFAVEV
ncbi:hypothetical protein ACFR9U_15825 [Halorientalis brevis]|uniref:DUF8130 domain-containing protein n=1 Tax=Halorientalis brevis TaxID=1126241 RepID=A0ABD6CFI4_9EURY|nr:hypothetical protein [Halorientalis brevis]